MVSDLGLVGVVAGALLLGLSGMHHARQWKRLLSSLLKHNLVPYQLARILARTARYQVVVAAVMLGAVVAAPTVPLVASAVGWGATAMFFAMAAYVFAVLRLRPGATCACFGSEQPLGWFSAIRLTVLAACSAGFAAQPPANVLGPSHVTAALALAITLFAVPLINYSADGESV